MFEIFNLFVAAARAAASKMGRPGAVQKGGRIRYTTTYAAHL